MHGHDSRGSADQQMISPAVRSIGQSVTEGRGGRERREKREKRKVCECVMDRDGGNLVVERR